MVDAKGKIRTVAGTGKAGSVTLNAGDEFVSQNSKVTVGTEQADGGDITLNATTLIHLIDSQITATVKGGEGKGGNISIVGVYGPPWNLVPIGTAMNKGLTLRMNQCNVRRYMPHLLKHIREGRVDARKIISHRFPLEKAQKAYDTFSDKTDNCIKCVLLPHGEA